jgi:murein DD-endopeptidase MepM/ murein hydrolase activator NlpD
VENIELLPGRADLLDPATIEDEWARLEPLLQAVTPLRFWDGPFTMPTKGYISSPFGTRRSYNGAPPSGFHQGLDIANITGTLVVAPQRGQVVLAEPLHVRGNAIILDHGWGVHSGYFHLSSILVDEGQIVEQGQTLGEMGATGLVSGSHLHWEIRLGLTAVDPQDWLARVFP